LKSVFLIWITFTEIFGDIKAEQNCLQVIFAYHLTFSTSRNTSFLIAKNSLVVKSFLSHYLVADKIFRVYSSHLQDF